MPHMNKYVKELNAPNFLTKILQEYVLNRPKDLLGQGSYPPFYHSKATGSTSSGSCSRIGVHNRQQKNLSQADAGGCALEIEIALTGRGWDTKTSDKEKLPYLSQLHQLDTRFYAYNLR